MLRVDPYFIHCEPISTNTGAMCHFIGHIAFLLLSLLSANLLNLQVQLLAMFCNILHKLTATIYNLLHRLLSTITF